MQFQKQFAYPPTKLDRELHYKYKNIWLRITDEGSVPEMRIWSILLIKLIKMLYTS